MTSADTRTPAAPPSPRRGRPAALAGLVLGVVAMGTSGYVVSGVLPDVARDLHVSVAAAGQLATAWAVTVALLGPPLTAATVRRRPKALLLVLTALFCVGTLGTALAPTYPVLLLARVVAASSQGTYFAVGLVVAVRLFPAGQAGRAVAAVTSGLAFATVLGVPAGTLLGQAAGWRLTFGLLAGLGVLAGLVLATGLPATDREPAAPVRVQVRSLLRREVLACFVLTLVAYCGVFATFTYLGALLTTRGAAPLAVVVVLAAFGAGGLVGSQLAGRTADRRPLATLVVALTALAASVATLPWTVGTPVAAAAATAVFGAAAFATIPVLQARVLALAADAPTLAAAVNVAVFNLSDGSGAALGGVVVATAGLAWTPWATVAVALAGLAVAIRTLRPRPA